MSGLSLALPTGEQVTVEHATPEGLRFASPRPFPPGAPLELREGTVPWAVKVRGSRRQGDRFLVEARWVNLTRAQRERLHGPSG